MARVPGAKQEMIGVTTTDAASQMSDQVGTTQSMSQLSARTATQNIRSQDQSVQLWGWKAKGAWGIAGLVIVAITALVVKLFTG